MKRFSGTDGESAWLSNQNQVDSPFVLVLVAFNKDRGQRLGLLTPFAHLGIEVPRRQDVDRIADVGRNLGCLHWEPQEMHEPVGYICALTDPDGNVVEISHNQRVHDTVQNLWGRHLRKRRAHGS